MGMLHDKELAAIFINGYNKFARRNFVIDQWPDEVNRNLEAIDAIAKDSKSGEVLAIEHTLLQPFAGEVENSCAFRTVFEGFEQDPSYRDKDHDIYLWPSVSGVPRRNWESSREAISNWFLNANSNFPLGSSIHEVPGLAFKLKICVRKHPHPDGRVMVGRGEVPDNLFELVQKALTAKLPKLLAATADIRVLLLEVNVPLRSEKEVSKNLDRASKEHPSIIGISEIWLVDTAIFRTGGDVYLVRVWPNSVSAILHLRSLSDSPEEVTYLAGRELAE
jgi:hypothetical protein